MAKEEILIIVNMIDTAKEKKEIIFIVEGSSDKAALENIFKKYTEGIRKLILDLPMEI